MDEENSCSNFYINPIKSDSIIFENTTPDENIYEQARGRIMRSSNPSVIILRDNNASSKRHIKDLNWWFKETNGTIIEISYKDLILPRPTQIFTRQFNPDTFYRIITIEEYELFSNYHILDDNEYDKSLGGYEIFKYSDQMLKKYKQGIVLTLISLNTASRIINGTEEFISLCPVCNFHVNGVSKL